MSDTLTEHWYRGVICGSMPFNNKDMLITVQFGENGPKMHCFVPQEVWKATGTDILCSSIEVAFTTSADEVKLGPITASQVTDLRILSPWAQPDFSMTRQ